MRRLPDPNHGFSDVKDMSVGVGGLTGARHTIAVTSVALLPFMFWDGRADSAWRQPLFAIENDHEMNFTRSEVAHFIASKYGDAYQSVFGALPDLSGVPARAKPGDPAWNALPPSSRDTVERVFVNVGKALEAYERRLSCVDTRFDRWSRGELQLSAAELDGAARFVSSGCTNGHTGPALSDGAFHDLGLSPANANLVDTGREGGIALLLADELNGASSYSDDASFGALRLASARAETATFGAFRTASLRGVAQRPRFGHQGAHTDLGQFIDDTYRKGRGGRGGGNAADGGSFVGSLDPLLDRVNVDDGDVPAIVAFLGTLDCQPVPSSSLASQ